MGFFSLFRSQDPGTKVLGGQPSGVGAPASELPESAQLAKVRARHRLLGAAVLLLLGVIIFPLLFETQPRPVALDIPIEIPRKDQVAALTLPAKTKPPATQAANVPDPAPLPKPIPLDPGALKSQGSGPMPQPTAPGANATSPSPPIADKPARFVLQAGAFSDNAAAKEARAKLDKLGLKTFVQTADTSDGKRIRVRAGPYGAKAEAEKDLERLKAAGVSAVVLAL